MRDHGPGFAEADLAHVFERFYRARTRAACPDPAGAGHRAAGRRGPWRPCEAAKRRTAGHSSGSPSGLTGCGRARSRLSRAELDRLEGSAPRAPRIAPGLLSRRSHAASWHPTRAELRHRGELVHAFEVLGVRSPAATALTEHLLEGTCAQATGSMKLPPIRRERLGSGFPTTLGRVEQLGPRQSCSVASRRTST